MELIKQNVKVRNAQSYADPHLVEKLCDQFLTQKEDIDEQRKKRNQHAGLTKQILTMEDDVKREKKMEEHVRVGKCIKKSIQAQEHRLDEVEHELVRAILSLPNKIDVASPIGDEDSNVVIKEVDSSDANANETLPDGLNHLEIARRFDLVDFQAASNITGNKFVFLKNEAAQLELALCQWVLGKIVARGFEPISPPEIVRTQIAEACGF